MISVVIHILLALMIMMGIPGGAHAERSGCPRMAIAAQQGDPDRQFLYAQALDKGYCGFKVDERAAFRWYRRAAKQGQMEAQTQLGEMYLNGRGVDKNRREAYFWLSIAASTENPDAPSARDEARKGLTPHQIATVDAKVRIWKPTHAP